MTGTGAKSFSQLLLSDDVDDDVTTQGLSSDNNNHHHDQGSFRFGFSDKPGPKMLCFGGGDGGYTQNDAELLFPEASSPAVTCYSDPDPSVSSCNNKSNIKNNAVEKSSKSINKKRNGSGQDEPAPCSAKALMAPVNGNQKTGKKTKTDTAASAGNTKVRKEKLGERVTALQQLVSPYGKTDTASVLHEAMGYIRFLHDQVQVLCSPYLHHHNPHNGGGEDGGKELVKVDLRSRGLCLVPVSCTVHVANTNGADLWSPAMGHSLSLSSMKQRN